MSYLLYMKRSFTRNPRRHAVLFAVMTCAFLLPLLICIYRDSNAYGTRQYLLARSAGETYHIGNATEADVPYFEGIRGLSAPVYRPTVIIFTAFSPITAIFFTLFKSMGNTPSLFCSSTMPSSPMRRAAS